MILVGLGANIAGTDEAGPLDTCAAALGVAAARGVRVVRRSGWYRSAPVPMSDQPWYVNGVAVVETELTPAALLAMLHGVEAQFGRVRGERNMSRTLDLDLLAYGATVQSTGAAPLLPHPRMHERAFVLVPLAEVAPHWRHPGNGMTVAALIAAMPPGQRVEAVAPVCAPEAGGRAAALGPGDPGRPSGGRLAARRLADPAGGHI